VETKSINDGSYLTFSIDKDFNIALEISAYFVALGLALLILFLALHLFFRGGLKRARQFEVDTAELGMGNQKLVLKPNETDRQIAYKIWVELSTRKIGLKIDLEHDVISEVYDSWYSFFSVTRELVKDVPVSKFRRRDTEKIVNLSIEVLNSGIRPHLTKWQARFRHWYNHTLEKQADLSLAPQDIQKQFPHYDELRTDILEVNLKLILYRQKMYELVTSL